MAEKFEFYQGPARAGAAKWAEAAGIASAAAAGVGGLNDSPWSDDKIGSAFAEKFDPNRAQAIKNVQELAKQLGTFEPNLTKAINSIVAREG
ncbi:hypothetical protein DE4585_03919 [Mycobacteroides salmoniphilum]|uniref:Uncharacterized protein n=1 Tax=Mycobacteroides salmoniphilum TaxID=404941 RepID=A0A4R8RU86_9MYCO|nr:MULTISPECIES: hypothetical protein [Mycobacteriaceae]TDZ78083.1 hypothetical protein DE4585_03919 [Mycobacteroides salmoniphilum]